jgi:coenzyme PQQ precursor peptide PqqA
MKVSGSRFEAATKPNGGHPMKIWTAPAVREQNVGLEVTSYLPADIDLI